MSHLKKLDCQREPVVLHTQPGNKVHYFWPSEMGNPNSLNESQCDKPLVGHLFQHNGTSDCFSGPFYDETLDERNNITSQHIESNGLLSYSAAQSSNWFRPSSTDLINSPIGSYENSFGSFVTDDANFHKLQNNTTNCSFSLGSAEEFGLIYQQHMKLTADADLDGLNGNHVNLDGETPLQNRFSKSIDDLGNISSPCMLQMGEASLAHSTLAERYGSVSEKSCGMNRDAMPYSTVNEGIHTSFVAWRPEDLALPQQYKVRPEINCPEAINDSHVANNISLAVPGDFLVIAEDVLRPSMSVQVSGLSKDSSKCTWQEQSTHSSVLDDSAVDFNTLLPCGMCFQQCSCEIMGVTSESSTDSSPLPYNHKHLLLNGDLAYMKINSGHKMDLQTKRQKSFLKEKKQPPISTNHQQQQQLFELSRIASQSNPSRVNSTLDDDSGLFILDDISHSVPHALPSALANYVPVAERCSFSNHTGSGTIGATPDDKRLIFRLALQRIALSWMVQKESSGLNCSGGILADDQGLGKTISTIALILTERPPSSCSVIKKYEFEPLNLDDEDDGGGSIAFEGSRMEKLLDNGPSIHVKPEKVDCSFVPVKGRPPAGTLVVCPTSVLRQWADELQNKITRKANLTFLVYHGSNRTKDPYELAKFDVVITTYAIVSMEVPKQPLVDKDDKERGKHSGCSMLAGNLAGNKRKEPSNTSSKNPKRKIALDNSVLEFAPRPLAKVGWFRVILDEAQSIKNHRTQVARACWGLRAKRRWCLSGTPIQNAVDDLYSYFRFLRYDPYAVYKSFCSTIKIPISRNPINGYKKLQAVLKTVMLRRTKGTLIDGKPIISLPPKSVTLKKVDFSNDELEFYLTLEAESREQFKVYAAAGTVKQNYVNILLMLLRLRQACDHPLLVKCTVSNSVWKSSLETAKKLPMDKLLKLQTCLEACLAICTICHVARCAWGYLGVTKVETENWKARFGVKSTGAVALNGGSVIGQLGSPL
ncbi:hypothetical protein KSP40_PGU006890 [Platanthera guangdongensis]|uniref:Helicase ATP-binding domain-containing protein n=1 Tax=Platanthera guangdongensis TaxID=2320717 RepID=A0ABR2LWR8_9ASPA